MFSLKPIRQPAILSKLPTVGVPPLDFISGYQLDITFRDPWQLFILYMSRAEDTASFLPNCILEHIPEVGYV